MLVHKNLDNPDILLVVAAEVDWMEELKHFPNNLCRDIRSVGSLRMEHSPDTFAHTLQAVLECIGLMLEHIKLNPKDRRKYIASTLAVEMVGVV